MRIFSGMKVQAHTGWSALARINKWGNNNTNGTAWPSVQAVTMRVTVAGGGFNSGAVTQVVVWKVWTDSNGVPRSVLFSDQPVTRGLVLGVEDTGTYWQLVASGTPTGSVVEIETLSTGSQPGVVTALGNNPFTYTPVGPVGKPFASHAHITPSTGGTANQYIPIASIAIDARYQRYAGVFEVAEVEGVEGFVHRLSVLINQSNPVDGGAGNDPSINLTELTDLNRKSTLFFYTKAYASGVWRITIYAQSTLTYSTLAISVPTEGVNAVTVQPKVQILPPGGAWQTAQPSGATRVNAIHSTYGFGATSAANANFYFQNGWAAASGFNNSGANGLFIVNRVVTLRLQAAAGTLAASTAICQFSSEWKPQFAFDFHGVGTDASGNHFPIRLNVSTAGAVTVVGTIPSGVTSIVADATWETFY